MSKFKLFTENILVYGLGGIISKIIPVLMIPIITRLLPNTSYYGISDLCSTIISFGGAIATLGMYDAMYRMFFEKDDEEYKRIVCSTTVLFTIGLSLLVASIVFFLRNHLSILFFKNQQYNYLVIIAAISIFSHSTNTIISAPTRMQNNKKIFLLTNTIAPIISYSIAIPLILNGYYIIALPLSSLICGIIMEITFYFLNRKWFWFKTFNWSLLKQLLILAIPIFPLFIFYWIFNSSDKLMISNLIDTAAVGIYATGSKLGHCSQLIYTAFAGGWQFFAFSTMKDKKQVTNNSLIFEYLGIISFICSMFVFVFCKTIYQIIFTGKYVEGYIVSPYLFLAPLLLMLYQVIGNQFLVIKKTWPGLISLSLGATVNIILNLLFIPRLGIEGAGIATLLGYTISIIVCSIMLIKMNLLVISKKFLFSVVITILFIFIWRLYIMDKFTISLCLAIFASSLILLLYKEDIQILKKLLLKNLINRI